MTTNIICNLKRAHPIIEKGEKEIREFIKEHLSKNIKNKKFKLKFNKRLFIKSLLSSVEFKKSSPLLLNKNINYNKINQKNNKKDEISKTKKIINNERRIKRSSSYKNYKEENDNLNEMYNIKSNKKFMKVNIVEIEKEKDNISFKKPNKLYLSAKKPRKLKENKYNHFLESFKDNYNNQSHHNILLFSSKRNSDNFSMNNSNITDQSFISKKSIKSNSVKSINSNLSIQSFLNENFFKKIQDNNIHLKNMYRNEKKVDVIQSKFRKINRTYFREKSPKQDYLKFLEKKSLALRANYIMNNIQDNRGGKQEVRSLYNPFNV